MALNRKTAVIGSAIMAPVEDETRSLEEVLYEVTQRALKDAGLKIEDVDGIVVASNDQFDGRAISIMAASGSVGGVDRDILSTPSASEHAFVMGVLRIASGQYETHLIVSWSPTEASSLSEAQRLGADPYFHRKLPLDEAAGAALQASAVAARTPAAHQLAVTMAERGRARGERAYPGSAKAGQSDQRLPWPLKDGMIAAPVTGAVALVIASEDFVDERGVEDVAWLHGMGWATEPGFLGDRDLASAPALEAAVQRAFEEAGMTSAASADLVELTDVTPYQELVVYDALGLSGRESWAEDVAAERFEASGDLPINPSGGVATLNPVFCTGLIRIAEAANQVRGRAGRHQISDVKSALAHAASGFAMMYQSVFVLGADRKGAQA